MSKRFIAAASVVAILSLAGPATAQDAPPAYPPAPSGITSSHTTVVPGGAITLTATGFGPGTPVTFTIASDSIVLGTVHADPSGTAVLTTTLPPGISAGTHTVTAHGVDAAGNPITRTLTITVSATAGPASAMRAKPRYAG